jgi:hypothetical protein
MMPTRARPKTHSKSRLKPVNPRLAISASKTCFRRSPTWATCSASARSPLPSKEPIVGEDSSRRWSCPPVMPGPASCPIVEGLSISDNAEVSSSARFAALVSAGPWVASPAALLAPCLPLVLAAPPVRLPLHELSLVCFFCRPDSVPASRFRAELPLP